SRASRSSGRTLRLLIRPSRFLRLLYWDSMTRRFLVTALGLAPLLLGADPSREQARKLYARADFAASLQWLLPLPGKERADYDLIGRNYYMMGDYKKAGRAFQEGVAAGPDSDRYLWLGRAFGRRAEHATPFTAPGYASKARQNFEKAIEIDPSNLE